MGIFDEHELLGTWSSAAEPFVEFHAPSTKKDSHQNLFHPKTLRRYRLPFEHVAHACHSRQVFYLVWQDNRGNELPVVWLTAYVLP